MRSILSIVCLVLIATSVVSANVLDRVIRHDLYVGGLYTGSVVPPSDKLVHDVSFRVANQLVVGSDKFRMTSRFAWTTPSSSAGQFWLTDRFSDKHEVRAGFLPRPMAVLMRAPLHTADSHFEAAGEAVIPGTSWGVASVTSSNEKVTSAFGVYLSPAGHLELNGASILMSSPVNLSLGALYSVDRATATVRLKADQFKIVVCCDNDSTAGGFLTANTFFGDPYCSYVGQNDKLKDYRSLEAGITRDFGDSIISGLVGGGYDWVGKAIRIYVFVHI